MTPKENFLHFFRNEPYEWIPSSNDILNFKPVIYPENISRGSVEQQNPMPEELYGGVDSFGVEWVYEKEAGGSMEARPLLDDIDDLLDWEEKIIIPDPASWDWEAARKENAEYLNTDKIIRSTIYTGFFERLISLVGFEDAAIALIDDEYQDEVKALFDRIADYYIDLGAHMKKYFGVDWIEVHDDWGTQRSLMFSKETHREMIFPYIKKVVDGFHELGIIYEQHSCGLIEDLIPSIIESGADTWKGQNVVDKKKMVDMYGDRFLFGVSIASTGPGDDEETIGELRKALDIYKGKKVWYFMFGYTEEQKKLSYGLFRKQK